MRNSPRCKTVTEPTRLASSVRLARSLIVVVSVAAVSTSGVQVSQPILTPLFLWAHSLEWLGSDIGAPFLVC